MPGYAMRVKNGWWSSVVSLTPGVISTPPVASAAIDNVEPTTLTPDPSNSAVAP
jgi:hypothetical protein